MAVRPVLPPSLIPTAAMIMGVLPMKAPRRLPAAAARNAKIAPGTWPSCRGRFEGLKYCRELHGFVFIILAVGNMKGVR